MSDDELIRAALADIKSAFDVDARPHLEEVMREVIKRLRAGGISDLTIRNTLVTPRKTMAEIKREL